jgi:hypothetical protein
MSKIENATANRGDAVRLLQDHELDTVNGGVWGDRGCIPPFSTLDPRFLDWVRQTNAWLDLGSVERRLPPGS